MCSSDDDDIKDTGAYFSHEAMSTLAWLPKTTFVATYTDIPSPSSLKLAEGAASL